MVKATVEPVVLTDGSVAHNVMVVLEDGRNMEIGMENERAAFELAELFNKRVAWVNA